MQGPGPTPGEQLDPTSCDQESQGLPPVSNWIPQAATKSSRATGKLPPAASKTRHSQVHTHINIKNTQKFEYWQASWWDEPRGTIPTGSPKTLKIP